MYTLLDLPFVILLGTGYLIGMIFILRCVYAIVKKSLETYNNKGS